MKFRIFLVLFVFALALSVHSNFEAQSVGDEFVTLTVQTGGNGSGIVVSSPPGIDCGDGLNRCSAVFTRGTPVTLSAKPLHGPSTFQGWSLAHGSAQQCPGSRSDCSMILLVDSTARADFVID